jgi:hypothetical protein
MGRFSDWQMRSQRGKLDYELLALFSALQLRKLQTGRRSITLCYCRILVLIAALGFKIQTGATTHQDFHGSMWDFQVCRQASGVKWSRGVGSMRE